MLGYAGFYIQSSGEGFLTDYYVKAVYYERGDFEVGRVCGATSNFTLVLFNSPDDEAWIWSDTIFIYAMGANGNANSTRINEIWPIYRDDPSPIFYPNNTAACPTSTPTTSPAPTVTPTFPGHPDVTLTHWPRNWLATPNPGIPSAKAAYDYNLLTSYQSARSVPDIQIIRFSPDQTFEGWYIKSAQEK